MKRSPLRRVAMRHTRPKPGIPESVRLAVIARDESRCARCGTSVANVPSSVHHRKPRKAGGRYGFALTQSYDMANLTLLCGTGTTGCHGEIESDRSQAYDDGWLVREYEDPRDVPCLIGHEWWQPGDWHWEPVQERLVEP